MEDAHLPPDANDGKDDDKGDQARRAGRRLSDAEAVASTRRDMFGDGPLIDVVAVPQPGDATQTQGVQDAAAPQNATPPPPLADAVTEYADLHALPGADTATPAGTTLANVAQSLDTIIDSFPAESASHQPGASFPEPHGLPPPAPASMGVSAIFDSLAAPDGPGTGVGGSVLVPVLSAWPSQQDGGRGPDGDGLQHDSPVQGDMPGAVPGGADGEAHVQPPADLADSADGRDAGRGPLPSAPVVPFRSTAGSRLEGWAAGIRSYPDFPSMPPFPGTAEDAGATAYPESAMPSFRAPLTTVATYNDAEASQSEPAGDAVDPAPSEPAQPPSFIQSFDSEPAYADPPPFPGQVETPVPPPPIEDWEPRSRAEPVATPMLDSAAQIAAEADATAEALENLKRLLANNPAAAHALHPSQFAGFGAGIGNARAHIMDASAPFGTSSMLPLPVPPEPPRARGIYMLGFLTGLVLSLMAGVALYFLINMS